MQLLSSPCVCVSVLNVSRYSGNEIGIPLLKYPDQSRENEWDVFRDLTLATPPNKSNFLDDDDDPDIDFFLKLFSVYTVALQLNMCSAAGWLPIVLKDFSPFHLFFSRWTGARSGSSLLWAFHWVTSTNRTSQLLSSWTRLDSAIVLTQHRLLRLLKKGSDTHGNRQSFIRNFGSFIHYYSWITISSEYLRQKLNTERLILWQFSNKKFNSPWLWSRNQHQRTY